MSNGGEDLLAYRTTLDASSTPSTVSSPPSRLKYWIKLLRDLAERLHDQADTSRTNANLYIHLAPGARTLQDQLWYVSRAAAEFANAIRCDGAAYECEALAKVLSALDL